MLVAPTHDAHFWHCIGTRARRCHAIGKGNSCRDCRCVCRCGHGFCTRSSLPGPRTHPQRCWRAPNHSCSIFWLSVFSGFAGAYALVDEHISPALPGVAIATAIVPPLANCGICFSLKAYEGGIGSFLLFFANFLSILVVASVTFWFCRMTRGVKAPDRKAIVRRFGVLGGGVYHDGHFSQSCSLPNCPCPSDRKNHSCCIG